MTDLSEKARIEGIIFASVHPVNAKTISEVLSLEKDKVLETLKMIQNEYSTGEHGMDLQEIGGGFQFRTKPELKEVMARFYEKKPPRLSAPMLEVLSIIAYKQPVTRPEIEKIRGVDCTAVLKTLLEKELVEMQGRSSLPGSPTIYGTTPKFLEWFQIAAIDQLPPLSEVQALNKNVEEGSENLLDLLSRDDGFVPESIQEMDSTLQKLGRLKSIEEIEQVVTAPLSSEQEVESPAMEESISGVSSSGPTTEVSETQV